MGIAQTGGVKPLGIESATDFNNHEQPGTQPVNLHIQDAVLTQMGGNLRPDTLMVNQVLLDQSR
ncbi:hypothetical protein D3C80_2007590 [compost metagenome]